MIKKFLDHRIITALCGGGLLFVIGGFSWAFFVLRGMAPATSNSLILHFNNANGITSIGGLSTIVFMGAFGVLVTLMNFAIAVEFDKREPFFGKFLAAMTLLFGALLFIAFTAIITSNV